MKKLSVIATLLAVLVQPIALYADEGMWTFDNPPRKEWKQRYNFEPSDAWLENVDSPRCD